MIVILFRSRLTEQAGDDYAAMSQEMLDYGKGWPGFIDIKTFTADDGERLTVVWWQDAETLASWRNDPRHREAQRKGRERWYQSFRMDVAEVVRQSHFDRSKTERPAASGPNDSSF